MSVIILLKLFLVLLGKLMIMLVDSDRLGWIVCSLWIIDLYLSIV